MVLITSYFFVIFSFLSNASVGEINPDDYYGALYPQYKLGPYGEIVDLEEVKLEQILSSKIDHELFQYQKFFTEDLLPSSMCTKQDFKQYKNEIQSLYRYIILSLLFEKLKTSCSQKITLVKQCKSKTSRIKNYLETVLASRQSELWKKKSICPNCPSIKECRNLKEDFLKVCSEEDMFFGMSYAPTLFKIIQEVPLVSKNISMGCFRYYSLKHRQHEKVDYALKKQLRQIYENLSPQYPVGRFILANILNQYRRKGIMVLSGYKSEKKEVAKPLIAKMKKKTNIPQKKTEEKNILKEVTKKLKKKLAKPKMSAFAKAVQNLKELGLTKAKVDMNDFYFDYIFSSEKLLDLEKKLKKFTRISSLKKMYKEDDLGSKSSPIPLVFLKFLIDSKDHKALYGIIQVLGDQFYVLNDLNPIKKHQIALIELKNDEKVSFNWYLTVLDENEF